MPQVTFQNPLFMFMDNKWLSIIRQNITDKQEGKARMVCVLMDQSFRQQYELIFSLLLLRCELLLEIFIKICVYIDQYTYTYISMSLRPLFLILFREMADSKTRTGNTDEPEVPQQQGVHLVGQEIYKMSLQHSEVLENKKALKHTTHTHTSPHTTTHTSPHTIMGFYQRGTDPTEIAANNQSWNI